MIILDESIIKDAQMCCSPVNLVSSSACAIAESAPVAVARGLDMIFCRERDSGTECVGKFGNPILARK